MFTSHHIQYNCVYIYNRDFIVYLHHFTHYVHPVGEGNWKISDALNSSKTFHIIEGLEPGTEYTVRLMTKSWVDNSSIFEDVIRTSAKGEGNVVFEMTEMQSKIVFVSSFPISSRVRETSCDKIIMRGVPHVHPRARVLWT